LILSGVASDLTPIYMPLSKLVKAAVLEDIVHR
jgi:hypothetical protein